VTSDKLSFRVRVTCDSCGKEAVYRPGSDEPELPMSDLVKVAMGKLVEVGWRCMVPCESGHQSFCPDCGRN
jgi:hypothetical protein